MESIGSDWYKWIWSLDIKNQSWVEDTKRQVDFLEKKLNLCGKERILDLACGFGRHSLELARRGYDVVGTDITAAYIQDAIDCAVRENLNARFICSDIRELSFKEEFDVVLNMADGAIGYLENDRENLKIFDLIAASLKPGGKHYMDIMNAGYADTHFPCQLWDAGSSGLTLSRFEWNPQSCIMMYGQIDTAYGNTLQKPIMDKGNPTRLYHIDEIRDIMNQRDMTLVEGWADVEGATVSDSGIQMLLYSKKLE